MLDQEQYTMNYRMEEMVNGWDVVSDGPIISRIRRGFLQNGIPEEAADTIISNAVRVLNNCPNPANNENCQKTGIIIGKVQSGKTSNFISVAALAFDNGYNLVIVFGGTKKELVTQNTNRISETFNREQDAERVIVIDSSQKNELTGDNISRFIKRNKKVIIVLLKRPGNITALLDDVFSNQDVASKPVLIIDDEGDEASLNTLVSKGKKSSTYEAIEQIKAILHRHCFVTVTATPQANLLIDTVDILSPDFGILVDAGKGYCGLLQFHNDGYHCIPIPEDERTILESGIPKSFEDALALFFVSAAIREYRGLKSNQHTSMLVHPSLEMEKQRGVHDKVKAIVKEWTGYIEDDDVGYYNTIQKYLRSAFDLFVRDGTEIDVGFEEIEPLIKEAVLDCGIHLLNSVSVVGDAPNNHKNNIFVGGNKLGRGLTIDGLTITYITRTAKGTSAVDTVEQRARWFGYKESYIDVCRVFATKKIISQFNRIREHEDDLWRTIRLADGEGTEFKKIVRIFRLDSSLIPTRANVAPAERFVFNTWNFTREFQNLAAYNESNIRIIKDYRMSNQDNLFSKTYGRGRPYVILTSSFNNVYKQLLSKIKYSENDSISSGMLSKLFLIMKHHNMNPDIDVIWMRDGDTSKHSVSIDNSIPNFMVGRRKSLLEESNYKGDYLEFVRENTLQLQIHMFENKDTHEVMPAFAFYIPPEIAKRFCGLITRKGYSDECDGSVQ